jgi:hypothetical protein
MDYTAELEEEEYNTDRISQGYQSFLSPVLSLSSGFLTTVCLPIMQ